jgi:protein-tyrosine-phosphatase
LRRWEFDNDIFEDLDLDLQVKPVMIRIFETFCKRESSYLQRRNRNAVETMKEDGIDISQHISNHIDEYANIVFDLVITVCDNAKEKCPYFPGNAMKIHQNFADPSKFIRNDMDKISEFRRVREMIKSFSEKIISEELNSIRPTI